MRADANEPLVSVITPVYNGARYLAECIESVLSQTYAHWEYHLLNNCSTDDSLEVARNYERKERRIHVHNNKEFLSMVENFNQSLLHVTPESKYCKVLHADDRLFPDCISRMVSLAEAHPSVGIVSSYVLEGARIKCDGLPYPNSVFTGREIVRMTLMNRSSEGGGLYVFGSPTSLLIRSDLIKGRTPFYRDKYHQVVDQEACYHLLQKADFGFIHQVLTYSRLHDRSTTSSSHSLNRLILEELMLLLEYGPRYLGKEEYEERLQERMRVYYRFLAGSLLRRGDKSFWEYHKSGAQEIKEFCWRKVIYFSVREFIQALVRAPLHPGRTLQNIYRRFRERERKIETGVGS